jgi:hypothetical protein
MRNRVPLVAASLLACSWCGAAEAKKAALDAHLYATYSPDGPPGTGYELSVCGAVGDTQGCYGSGFLTPPFEQACALLEGTPKTVGNVMTRDIYVLDKRNSKTAAVQLYVYTRTDTFGANSDTVDVELTKQIALAVVGGKKAGCAMAANDAAVYAGTTASANVAVIDKKTLTATSFQGQGLLLALTADERGGIAVDSEQGFGIIPYDGVGGQGGGGQAYLVGTRNAWKP